MGQCGACGRWRASGEAGNCMQEYDVTGRLLLTGRSHLRDAETTMLLCAGWIRNERLPLFAVRRFGALSCSKGNYAEAKARISTVFIFGGIGKSGRIAAVTKSSEGRCWSAVRACEFQRRLLHP